MDASTVLAIIGVAALASGWIIGKLGDRQILRGDSVFVSSIALPFVGVLTLIVAFVFLVFGH